MKRFVYASSAFLLLHTASPAQTPQAELYTVNYTNIAPQIDGVLSPGEWESAGAADASTQFWFTDPSTPLRPVTWRTLFDATHFYIAVEVEREFFTSGFEEYDDGEGVNIEDSIHILFDPNRDGEENIAGPEMDSYQFWVALPPSELDQQNEPISTTMVRNPGESGPPYITTEARFDGTAGEPNVSDGGDPGVPNWTPEGIAIGRTVNPPVGAVVEFALPFSDIDITPRGVEDGGLAIEQTPESGDVWLFNLGHILWNTQSAAWEFRIWNFHPGDRFAQRPMGEIIFQGSPSNSSAWVLY